MITCFVHKKIDYMKHLNLICSAFLAGGLFLQGCQSPGSGFEEEAGSPFRAPAYPLVTVDPYFSAWSMGDQLFDVPVKHWTGRNQSLTGVLRVNGETYRFLGKEDIPLQPVIPTARFDAWEGKYVHTAPAEGWEQPGFDDSSWTEGKGAFGTPGSGDTSTPWETDEIWVRRTFTMPEIAEGEKLYLSYSHDDDFQLYLNGTRIIDTGNRAKSDLVVEIDKSMLHADGENVIAAWCLDRGGLAYVDFGILKESDRKDFFAQTALQHEVKITATQTKYHFTCGPVDLMVEFVSPLLMNDLNLLSRPVNYINYEVISNDGKQHEVEIYFEATPEWAVHELNQEVELTTGRSGDVTFARTGTTAQPVLQRKGDNVRIDWGYFYLAAGEGENKSVAIGDYFALKEAFKSEGNLHQGTERFTALMTESMPVLATTEKLGQIAARPVKGFVMLGYDDIESIQYFGENLKAWWRNGGERTFEEVLADASASHASVMEQCDRWDQKVYNDLLQAGGEKYARISQLAYRQSVAAHKLVKGPEGEMLFFSKENFSNGSIGTVDITFPSSPLYLKYNPELLKGMMNPILYFSASGKWPKPFAAHDVGTYPLANGQTYGGDMPIEETGNMLILATAIAHMEGNAAYAAQHWQVLSTWADYLLENGLDPDNQLCTDDFAGHFAHNVNLSVKAIMGIAGYGRLAEMLGKADVAEKYTTAAKAMAQEWMKMADDGDHYRLTFDKPGTWSQKYNMVWNELLGLDIFPDEIMEKEIAYYLTKQNQYGLPLDNRMTYTKADWIIWTATMADDDDTFHRLVDPLYDYVTETTDRVPLSDWYETTNANQVGFQARSVVGGFFIKTLNK